MNKGFLRKHGEKGRKALLKQPRLSQEEMLRQAEKQMRLPHRGKSETENSKP